MEPHITPARIPWPGLRFNASPGGEVTGLSADSEALEAQLGGRWHDLSIVQAPSRQALLAALGSPQAFELDIRLRDSADGHPMHMRCATQWDAQRHEHACRLAPTSDLQQAIDATDRDLHQLQQLVDSLPLLLIQLDTGPQLRCTFAGGALLELITALRSEAVGCDASSLFGPELHAGVQALLRQSAQGQAVPFAWHLTDAQGRRRVLEGHLLTLVHESGRPSSHLIDALETTAYHDTLAELQSTEARLRRFVTASSDGILISEDDTILDANPASCRLLATTADALRQRRLQDLIAPEDRAAYLTGSLRPMQEPLECSLIDGHGARIAVELIARTVQRQGRDLRMAIVRDVRYRREAQARIHALIVDLRAQRDRAEAADRAKSLFLSAASHDLRQPIHALGLQLSGLESLARSEVLPTPLLKEFTGRMSASLDALSRLLNALLDISRLDAQAVVVQPAAVSLAMLFDELENDLGEAARAKGLQLDLVPTDAWVQTDAVVLHRILDNLISNAIRYTREGRVLVGARPRGHEIEIQVWDTGIGIAADQINAIFNEFYQVAPPAPAHTDGGLRGLGLGLSIVKRSACLLDADLKVRSTPGRGSVFSIRLPRTQPLPEPEPAEDAATLDEAGYGPDVTRHVLVIDDDAMVLIAMQQLLMAWGHEVWCASDPDQAIVLAVTHAHEIDLVLSDYHLGGETNSMQFIDTLRACIAQPVPVHVFTADTSMRVAQDVRSRGLSLLHKPVRQEALRQVLQQVVP